MTDIGRTINDLDTQSQIALVGEYLASGQLGAVYKVSHLDETDDLGWVIKLARSPQDGTAFLQSEEQVLSDMHSRLPGEVGKVLPAAKLVRVGNGDLGLLLERMDSTNAMPSALRKVRELEGTLAFEEKAWTIAYTYIKFIQAMHRIGYTCNDRKLEDFYYISDKDRLVVLDWNVIQSTSGSVDRRFQDILLLARTWFNLFGGSDENRFQIYDSRYAAISIVGRELLWNILNPERRSSLYQGLTGDPTDVFESQLKSLLNLFQKTTEQLQNELNGLLTTQPLSGIKANATEHETEAYLMSHWQIADIIQRRHPEKPQTVLSEITRILNEKRHRVYTDVSQNIEFSTLAIQTIERLQNEGANRDLLHCWRETMNALVAGAAEGIALKEVRPVLNDIQSCLTDFYYNGDTSQQLAGLIERFENVSNSLNILLSNTQIPIGSKLRAALQLKRSQVDVLQSYLSGERLLLDGEVNMAYVSFQNAKTILDEMSTIERQPTQSLLPEDPTHVLQQLSTVSPPPYAERLMNAMRSGNHEAAIQEYESARANPLFPRQHFLLLEAWIRPAYLVRNMQASLYAGDTIHALDAAAQVAMMQSTFPQAESFWSAQLQAAMKCFDLLVSQPSTPRKDAVELQLGKQIQRLITILNSN